MWLRVELPALPPLGASPLPRLSPLLRLRTHKATQTCRINFSAFPCGSRAFRAGRGPPVLPPPSPPPPPPLWPRQCHSPDTRGGGERSRTRRQMQIPLPPPRSTRTSGRPVRALPAATSLGARNRPGGRGCSPDKLSRAPGEDAGCSRGRAGGLAGGRASGEAGAARRRKEGFPRPGSGGRPTSAPRARLPEPASFSAAAPPGRPRRARHPGKRPRLPPSAPYLSLRAAEPPRLRLPPPPSPSGPLRARSGSEMAREAERDSGPSRRRCRRLPLPPQSPPQRSSPQPPRPPPAESSPERAMGPEGGRAQGGRPIDALGSPPRPRARGAGGGGSTEGGKKGGSGRGAASRAQREPGRA